MCLDFSDQWGWTPYCFAHFFAISDFIWQFSSLSCFNRSEIKLFDVIYFLLINKGSVDNSSTFATTSGF